MRNVRKLILSGTVALAMLLFASTTPAQADEWSFSFGNGGHGSSYSGSYRQAGFSYGGHGSSYSGSYRQGGFSYGGRGRSYSRWSGYVVPSNRTRHYHTNGYSPHANYHGRFESGAGRHARGFSSPYRHSTHHGYHHNPEHGWHGGTHWGHN